LKFSVTVTLKKDVLDPQGKVVQNTIKNLGIQNLTNVRQGKYFEIELNEDNEVLGKEIVEKMCQKLLVNFIIEDYKINKI
tara:strand:+ start:191 stop:430 length:240 start_codon:yes stop_codon:yes gene_type:complete